MPPREKEIQTRDPDLGPFLTHFEVSKILDPNAKSFEAITNNVKTVLSTVETSLQLNDLSVSQTGKVELAPAAEGDFANPFYKAGTVDSIYAQSRLLSRKSAVFGVVKSALLIPPDHPMWSNAELIETLVATCMVTDAFISNKYMPQSVVGLFALIAKNIAPEASYQIEAHLVLETPVRNNILKMIFLMNPEIMAPMMQIAKTLDTVQDQRDNSKKISKRADVLASYLNAMTLRLPIHYDKTNWPTGSPNAGRDIFERSIGEFLAIIRNARMQSQEDSSKSLVHGRQYPSELYTCINQLEAQLNVTGITYEDFDMLLLKLSREQLHAIKSQNSKVINIASTSRPLSQKP